jgi:tight adherence protein B
LAERAIDQYDREGRLGLALQRAGLQVRPPEFVAMVVTVMVIAILVALLFAGLFVALAVGVATGVGLWLFLSRRATKRQEQFEEQLGDSLQTITGGLRTGHSLLQAIDGLADEAESPTKEEFGRVLFETRLGHPLSDAMHKVAARMGSEDFAQVAEAVEIQQSVGGDLAELLDNVAETIRERRRIGRHIRTLTAEGRISAVILFCLPIAMLGFIAMVNKPYLEELTSTTGGLIVLAAAGVLMIIGGIWTRYIVRLRY